MTKVRLDIYPRHQRKRGQPRTPFEQFRHTLLLAALGLFGSAAAIYLGDTIVFYWRNQPLDQVMVTRYMGAPLKGDNTAFYYQGTGPAYCSLSMFGQNGWPPCWYLRKHPIYAEHPALNP